MQRAVDTTIEEDVYKWYRTESIQSYNGERE
jgi:hypothetical protein